MPDEKFFFCDTECAPHVFAHVFIKAEFFCIDGDRQHQKRRTAEHPAPGIFSAGKQIGRGTWNDALIQIFYWIFEVAHLICGVCVSNAYRHAVLLGATEYNAGKTIKMGVHNRIRRVGGEKFVQCMAVCGAERVLPRHGENFAAERVNLFIVRAFPCAVRQKIELHACAVYVTVVIHQHRFQSAAVHAGDNLQNTKHNGFLLYKRPKVFSP